MTDRPTLPKLPPIKRKRIRPVTGAKAIPLPHRANTTEKLSGGWTGSVWWQADDAQTAVGGTCQECGARVRAIDLRLHWTKADGDRWTCAECTPRDGVNPLAVSGETISRKPTSELRQPVAGTSAMQSMLNDLIQRNLDGITWHPPMAATRWRDPAELGRAFATAAHIANLIAREGVTK